jgi:hypothetical protein
MRSHQLDRPVVLPNKYRRHASDQQLADHYARAQGDTAAQEAARDQVLHEMQRRDQAQERREATEERSRQRYTARRMERAEAIERGCQQAETATTGYMLNRRGEEAKVSVRSLFTGPEKRARAYTSDSLLEHWETHPRLTEVYWQGQDTRIGYGRVYGVRSRITSEEQAWRDRYDRVAWEIEQAAA